MILVTADPLADLVNLSKIQTVTVRGIVLERKDLDEIGKSIRAIYDPQPTPTSATVATPLDVKEMMRRMEHLHREGLCLSHPRLGPTCGASAFAPKRAVS